MERHKLQRAVFESHSSAPCLSVAFSTICESVSRAFFPAGVVTLLSDYEVCKEGDVLTPEQARVLVSNVVMHKPSPDTKQLTVQLNSAGGCEFSDEGKQHFWVSVSGVQQTSLRVSNASAKTLQQLLWLLLCCGSHLEAVFTVSGFARLAVETVKQE